MSASDTTGFGKFIPGFDFLQNLSKGVEGASQMPNLAHWIAPTLNAEELDKRIDELKSVQFWLEQNSRALSATIQAMEVQKLTLATLKGMNFNLSEVANALKPRPAATPAAAPAQPQSVREPVQEPKEESEAKAAPTAASPMVDPIKLWGSLTQQFQQIAASAVRDAVAKQSSRVASAAASAKAASGKSASAKSSSGKSASAKATTSRAKSVASKSASGRSGATKTAARKTGGR